MASARRRARHRYLGAPWKRGGADKKNTKMERTKQSKTNSIDSGRCFILPLIQKPNGIWSYRHGQLARQIKKS